MLSDLGHLLPLLLLDQVVVHDPERFPDRCCFRVGLVLLVQRDLNQLLRKPWCLVGQNIVSRVQVLPDRPLNELRRLTVLVEVTAQRAAAHPNSYRRGLPIACRSHQRLD